MNVRIGFVGLALAACAGAQKVEGDTKLPLAGDAGTNSAVNVTRAEAVFDTLHGARVDDPYRWLEDEKAAEVQAWMKAQDAVARTALAKMPRQSALTKRFSELYYLDVTHPPVKRGGRYFYARQSKDKEKAVVYWKEGAKGPEKILLDPNTWSTDNTVSLGTWSPSWDGKKVVFAQKPNAADESTLYVLDVATGERSKVDVIEGAKYASPSWTPDSKGFYYEWLPADAKVSIADRPGTCEIRFHALGTDPKADPLVHPRTGDPKTFIGSAVSRDGKYLLVTVMRGWNENDVYFKRLGKDKEFRLLVAGKDAKYDVFMWKDVFYVLTDEGAPNKRVFKVNPAKPERAAWVELIPEDKAASIQDAALVGGHFALTRLRSAVSEVSLYALTGKLVRQVALPGLGTTSPILGLQDDDEAFFAFSSFTAPMQAFALSVKTGATTQWSKTEVPVDPTPYQVEQVRYPSKDGTLVSMFIVGRKDLKRDGNNPVLLYGYGGFDISLTSSFTGFIYPWLEAGGVYAVPNLRGGGEYGKSWHDAGKLGKKQNVFDDFIAAAEYLIREKYTSPKRLAIRGGSNGGLLVGAAVTQAPQLFGAVICAVPLLDMVRYPLFGSGKTWVPEYGDPESAEAFAWLHAYSPYHRVQGTAAYPPLLMMSSGHDDRVDPMHARKFVARLASVSKAPVLLRIEMNAGHGGADQVKKSVASSADQLAFLFESLGISSP